MEEKSSDVAIDQQLPDALIDQQSSDTIIDHQLDTVFDIRCPITGMIMKDPAVAQDNIIYERDAIEDWFKGHNTSPHTRQAITKEVIPVLSIKNYIEDYVKKHSELKDEVYVPILSHGRYKKEIDNIIKNKKWDELKQYTGFELKLFGSMSVREKLFKKCTNEVLKHVIDNIIDLESKLSNGWRLIHYLSYSSTSSEMIKYTIDKGVDLESVNDDGHKPIYYILRYGNMDTICKVCKYFNKTKITWSQLKVINNNNNIKTFEEYYKVLTYFKENNLIE